MQANVAQSIILLATNDPETSSEELSALREVCAGKIRRQESTHRLPPVVPTEEAKKLIGRGGKPVSDFLLRKLLREGKIHRAPSTGRRIWYYRAELEKLVYGIEA